MKKLIYMIEGSQAVYNPATEEVEQRQLLAKMTINNPTDKEIANAAEIAWNGEYTVEDDGEPLPELTDKERIAQLEEALDMLLSGVTE